MNPPIKYINAQNRKVDKFVDDVLTGKIVVNKWIRLAVERYKSDLQRSDLVLNQKKVDKVFHFFSLLKINIKNKYKQFELFPYQAFILKNLFLFYYPNGKRRYRYAFLFISRKSGKTVFATALNLYFLVADGVQDPQCLLLASTREQATIALEYAKSIVINSPALKKVEIQRYLLKFDYKKSRGILKTLASNANRLDGYSPSSAILDEIHSYTDDALFKVIKSGILSRENPMIILISTAGFNIDSFCFEMVEMGKNVLQGNIDDDSFFYMLFTLDDDDNFRNEENWQKSNPAIGKTISLQDMRIEFKQATNRPSELSNFLTKNLNIFVESSEQWIDENAYANVYKDYRKDLSGARCYMGVDLSSTSDLTSIVLVFEIENTFYVKSFFFLPNNPKKKLRKGGIDLSVWIDAGFIIPMKTKTLDYDYLLDFIKNLAEKYEIVSMHYDPFNSALLVPKVEELGIECKKFTQNAMNFNFPLKFIEKNIFDKNIYLQKNPVLRWNFRNAVLYVDGNGNIKIMKNKSNDAVDGVVSLAMAMAGWIDENLNIERNNLRAYLNA